VYKLRAKKKHIDGMGKSVAVGCGGRTKPELRGGGGWRSVGEPKLRVDLLLSLEAFGV